MRRVVINVFGIVSSIGNNTEEVAETLKLGKAGVTVSYAYPFKGLGYQDHAMPKVKLEK